MKKIINIIVALNLFFLCSCAGFLKESSQNLAYVENLDDLEEILLGEGYIIPVSTEIPPDALSLFWSDLSNKTSDYFARIHIMDDDATEFANGSIISSTKNYPREAFQSAHTWQINPFDGIDKIEKEDVEWTLMYRKIAILNSILFQVNELRATDEVRAKRIEGEAYFLRAQYYFWLTNIYAQPYRKETAATDPGIPLKITEYIEDKYYSRAPLKKVYEQIVSDLNNAAECLKGVKQRKPIRAGEYAPYALLSRVYLFMEEYEKSIEAANIVIDSKYEILNYNLRADGLSTTFQESTETIFTQGYNCMGALHTIETEITVDGEKKQLSAGYTSSKELLECYEPNDLRLKKFFVERSVTKGTFRCIKWRQQTDGVVSDRWLIRLPEIYLNKAESEAALGRTTAVETLQLLRANRFASDKLTEIHFSGAELVRYIRDERRRELCYEGHRWFDLRRYAVNSKYPFQKKIVHGVLSYDETNGLFYEDGEYELEEYDKDMAAYVIPVPRDVIEFNKGEMTNLQRKERQKKTN